MNVATNVATVITPLAPEERDKGICRSSFARTVHFYSVAGGFPPPTRVLRALPPYLSRAIGRREC